jgi:hypothetical protein
MNEGEDAVSYPDLDGRIVREGKTWPVPIAHALTPGSSSHSSHKSKIWSEVYAPRNYDQGWKAYKGVI